MWLSAFRAKYCRKNGSLPESSGRQGSVIILDKSRPKREAAASATILQHVHCETPRDHFRLPAISRDWHVFCADLRWKSDPNWALKSKEVGKKKDEVIVSFYILR
jgi:hypothetical protein